MLRRRRRPDVLQGTLDLLVLKTLSRGPQHGYGIATHIERVTNDALRVEEGSLYPALHRMEQHGWITAAWSLTENNRRARLYKLTRAGDSPILGAGLYVDGDVGAAGSTGRGEANLYNLSSFVIVDEMRRGAHPKDAAITALKRVAKNTIEKRLLNAKGQPNFGLSFYCLNQKGDYAGVAMYESTYAVCTENGPQTLKTDALFDGRATD